MDPWRKRWVIPTDRGDRFRAWFVCMANGPLNRPKLPGVPGIESYKGHSFHTSRWDYEYMGGDGPGILAFSKILDDWRDAGNLDGLELTRS